MSDMGSMSSGLALREDRRPEGPTWSTVRALTWWPLLLLVHDPEIDL